jgi:phosphoribosylformylglycinamidine cyclo-ligase
VTLTYKKAGVDIDAGDELVERIKPLARSTRIAEVVTDVGGFAGLCRIPEDIEEPLLVSGTDGVGTKLKVAFATGQHGTIGQDLVAMCVNDLVTTGARPLFFLDYFACDKLDVDVAERVIAGIADGCRLAGCALLGGETAEHPGMHADGEYDLAGFAVGVVSKKALLGPARVRSDDVLIAVASSGIHSNGYSLVRRVFEADWGSLGRRVDELGETLGEALLRPTKIYAAAVAALSRALGNDLHALCHVTGGGIVGNLPRVLPEGVTALVSLPRPWPPIFELIARRGPVAETEMHRTFNLGVGLIAVVARERAADAISALSSSGEKAWQLGTIRLAAEGAPASAQIVAGTLS